MSTSNSFEFLNSTATILIEESLELIGETTATFSQQLHNSVIRSVNFSLNELQARLNSSYTQKQHMINLVPNQYSYALPNTIVKITSMVCCFPKRNLVGTATATNVSFGSAQNCFVSSNSTGCTLLSKNDTIGFNFTNPATISYIGLTGLNAKANYEIGFYNNNELLQKFASTTVTNNNITWFVLANPLSLKNLNIKSENDNILSLKQIYFCEVFSNSNNANNGLADVVMKEYTFDDWVKRTAKITTNNQGFSYPTQYFYDKQIVPNIKVYPTPTDNGQNILQTILFLGNTSPQSLENFNENIDIPMQYFSFLTMDVAKKLAMKFKADNPALIQMLSLEADKLLQIASLTEFRDNRTKIQLQMPAVKRWAVLNGQ